MNDRTYVIIAATEVEDVKFGDVLEDSPDTLRYSVDGTKTFVKFTGDTPAFLDGKTQHSHSEMKAVLATPEWAGPNDPPE